MERCKRICIAAKRSQWASDNIKRQRIISRIFWHLGHPSAKDILSRNGYISFSYRFRYRSKRETFLGKWHEPRKVGMDTCCHRHCLHESAELIRKAWTMARQKEHPNPASYHITIRDWIQKPFAVIRNKEIGQDQECQHTFAHLPLCELDMTCTPQLRA